MKPIPLKDIIEKLEMQNDEMMTFLNTDTGEFEYVETYPMHDYGEKYEAENYIILPSQYDIHEYNLMEHFCYTIESDEIMDKLLYAIRGSGAFNRFKGSIYKLGVSDAWYRYRNKAFRKIAVSWCEEHNIEFTDK